MLYKFYSDFIQKFRRIDLLILIIENVKYLLIHIYKILKNLEDKWQDLCNGYLVKS